MTALQTAASGTTLFYTPRSVSLPSQDLNTALELASLAAECPHARLRVVGHYSGDIQARENMRTGLLRAKALMAMLVGRGIPSEQIIIAVTANKGIRTIRTRQGNGIGFDIISFGGKRPRKKGRKHGQ